MRNFLSPFFGLVACSWMPHWACHYYRLETGTSFVVGSWSFTPMESMISLVVYGIIILMNLAAISFPPFRFPAVSIAGVFHVAIGSLHAYRLMHPFAFEVFGYSWSETASMREVAIVLPFGILCLVVASKLFPRQLV